VLALPEREMLELLESLSAELMEFDITTEDIVTAVMDTRDQRTIDALRQARGDRDYPNAKTLTLTLTLALTLPLTLTLTLTLNLNLTLTLTEGDRDLLMMACGLSVVVGFYFYWRSSKMEQDNRLLYQKMKRAQEGARDADLSVIDCSIM